MAVVPTRTPARPSTLFPSLPPSPAVVTDAIDRQTTRVRQTMSAAWDASGMTERLNALRSSLSSVNTIEMLILSIELYGLCGEIIPMRYVTTVPAVSTVRTPDFPVRIPDLFVLVSGSFWAPFSLWLTTSVILPYIFAYFFNLSLKVQQPSPTGHGYGTRRTTAAASQGSPRMSFDPLVFNVAKAIISYLVYANQFTFWDLFSLLSVERVVLAIPGGLAGLLTGSAVGTLGSLYEAVLRK